MSERSCCNEGIPIIAYFTDKAIPLTDLPAKKIATPAKKRGSASKGQRRAAGETTAAAKKKPAERRGSKKSKPSRSKSDKHRPK